MLKESFIGNPQNWDNHRVLLWYSLEATNGDVLELGCGYGSTNYIKEYCNDRQRLFFSAESDKEWANNIGSNWIRDWNDFDWNRKWSLAFVDHAPGEHRKEAIRLLKDNADIIVIHDSEPHEGYALHTIWDLFKYRVDLKTNGAWATAVSNKIDITSWKGESYKEYTIS